MQEIAQLRRANVRCPDRGPAQLDYKQLGQRLGTVARKREVTAAFAIGGIAFLLLGAMTSTRWSGRLPVTGPVPTGYPPLMSTA